MRLRTTLAVIGLVAAMGMMTGCKSWCESRYPCEREHVSDRVPPATGEGPWVKKGVIRAERDGVLVGFASTDPADDSKQLWLLRAGEYFPIEMWENQTLLIEYLPLDPMTHEDLCAMFGTTLTTTEPPKRWVLWSQWGEVGPCDQ